METTNPNVQQAVLIVVATAVIMVPVLAGTIFYWLQPYYQKLKAEVESRLGASNWALLQMTVRTFILSAEQVTGLDTNEKKKAYVVKLVFDFAQAHNIPVTESQIDALIEGILQEIKIELAAKSVRFHNPG